MDNIFGSHASPEDMADVRLLYETLDKLPVEQKEAIILYEIFGFSRKEIADIQQTTVLNIKMRLYRGRHLLSKLMKSDGGERNVIKDDTGNNIDSLHFSPASLKGAGHE
jgi:RNA polymerase sigma-70 factor (ECF subfamily)